MGKTVFHPEDLSSETSREMYRLITVAGQAGVQLTHLDFAVDREGFLSLDGMPADQWVDAMTMY